MHHALKISDEYAINYFVLANMYAYLGLYNTSIKFYEDTLKRQENFDAARKGLAAVKCQIKLQVSAERLKLRSKAIVNVLVVFIGSSFC